MRQKVGLEDFKFHDLRRTFGSVLAQNGVSTAVIQRLLEHSSPDLTNKMYTNVDPILHQAIDNLPFRRVSHILCKGRVISEVVQELRALSQR